MHFEQVILVLRDSLGALRLKQEVISHKLKNSTSKRPNIRIMNIFLTQNNLRCSIFPSLNTISKMFICKASIPKIHNFEENLTIEIYFNILPFQLGWAPLVLRFWDLGLKRIFCLSLGCVLGLWNWRGRLLLRLVLLRFFLCWIALRWLLLLLLHRL